MNSVRYSRWFVCACATVLVLLCSAELQQQIRQLHAHPENMPEDFPVYYVAGKLAREHGKNAVLYYPPNHHQTDISRLFVLVDSASPWAEEARASIGRNTLPFLYPPFAALFMEPVTVLGALQALLVWRILSFAFLLLSVYLALRLAGAKEFLPFFVLASAGALAFFPTVANFYQGQMSALILLLWTLGAYLIAAKKPVWSALCFALGTMLKVSPVLAAVLFLLRRQWKWLIAYGMWMALAAGAAVWRLGWHNHVLWYREVLPSLDCGVPYFHNQSLLALILHGYLGRVPIGKAGDMPGVIPRGLCLVTKAVGAALLLGTLFVFWKTSKRAADLPRELVILALVTLIISPIGWEHHFMLALLPLVYFWAGWWRDSIGRHTNLQLAAVTAATLAMGTVFPEYLIYEIRVPVLELALNALVPVASCFLLFAALWTLDEGASSDAAGNSLKPAISFETAPLS